MPRSPIWPSWLWAGFLARRRRRRRRRCWRPTGFGRLLQPLTVFHPEWVGERIDDAHRALARFRDRPGALAALLHRRRVRAGDDGRRSTSPSPTRCTSPIAPWDLAVIVPISFVVQMLPVSVNGFGVREATFSFYFTRLGLPIESALLLSLVAAGLVMLFSLTGAAVWFARGHH